MSKATLRRNGGRRWAVPPVTAVEVEGFKSLHSTQRLELRPLTILAGANSAGKSSIVQPLLLMKQTLEAPGDPGPLLLDGPNVKFTATEQFLARARRGERSRQFSVTFEIDRREKLRVVFKKMQRQPLRLEEMHYTADGQTLILREDMSGREAEQLVAPWAGERERPIPLSGMGQKSDWSVQRERCFLSVGVRVGGSAGRADSVYFPRFSPALPSIGLALAQLIHVPGLRGNPERTYPTTAAGHRFPGTFENHVASIIARWQAEDDQRLRALANMLFSLGLTWKVEAKNLDETRVELRVGRLTRSQRGGARDLVSIADVGFGVSQVLPVLVALLEARENQMVYLEQPEIHLHPRAQRGLAGALAEAAGRGVITVVETHSALLIRAIQTLVAEKHIAPRHVAFHWFARDPETGATHVTYAQPDRAGRLPDWPADFDDVHLAADGEYLDAVTAALRR